MAATGFEKESHSHMIDNIIVGSLAVAFSACGYVLYYYGIWKWYVKPHAFSFILWALSMGIVGAAQVYKDAGPGAWTACFSAVASLATAFYALKYSKIEITRSDKIAFVIGLSAVPLWYITKEPLWAVLVLTLIDTIGFYPTFRKSWTAPGTENATSYGLEATALFLSIIAVQSKNLTVLFYPVVLMPVNTALALYLIWRRHMMSAQEKRTV
jgi:hypothetical protein